MKWYCCLNETALCHYGESLIAAVHSCRQNTTLEPHFIYDGESNALTHYLESLGVVVHFHQNSFLHLIRAAKAQPGYSINVARGAYLRFDIPVVDPTDDLVLYTDVDVIFLSDPRIEIRPAILAAAPEYTTSTSPPRPYDKVFNSGVMVLNLGGVRAEREALVELSRQHDFYFHGEAGFWDQGALNKFFVGRWEMLPQSLNWRPFADRETAPEIVHFHGTKPSELAVLASGHSPPMRPGAATLFGYSKRNCLFALGLFQRYLTPTARRALQASTPDALSVSTVKEPSDAVQNALHAFFTDKLLHPEHLYGASFIPELRALLRRHLPHDRRIEALEWGSGFSTITIASLFNELGVELSLQSVDDSKIYQDHVARSLYADAKVHFACVDLTGPGRSQADPELAYSTWPLALERKFDFVFIDGRRRVECAYVAALCAHPGTIVVLHDFRRGRYQPVLGLYEVIEDTQQFRVMRPRADVLRGLEEGRRAVTPGVTEARGERPAAPAPIRTTPVPTCHLHVGTHKTGSSAIQAFLAESRAGWLERGLLVPGTGVAADGNHLPLVRALSSKPVPAEHAGLTARLATEIERFPGHDVVISSEHLEGLLKTRKRSRLIEFFRARGYRVTIVCFIRPQPDRLNASYAQTAKTFHQNRDVAEHVAHMSSAGRLLYSRWLDIAANENVELRALPYDAAARRGGVIAPFLRVLGLDDAAPEPGRFRENLSVGAAAIAAARTCMDRFADGGIVLTEGQRGLCHRALMAADAELPSAPFWGLSPATVAEVEAHYRADNEHFARAAWGASWDDAFSNSEPTPPVTEIDREDAASPGHAAYVALLETLWPEVLSVVESR